jgi:hypothetical protein
LKYTVTSRHAEDVGLARPVKPGGEFDDKDVPDHMKDRVKRLADSGKIIKSSQVPSGGE